MSVKNWLALVLGVCSTSVVFSQENIGESLEDFAFPNSAYYDKFHSDKKPSQEEVDLKNRLDRLLNGLTVLEERITAKYPCSCGAEAEKHAEHCKVAKVRENTRKVEALIENFHTKSESEVQLAIKEIRKSLEFLIVALKKSQDERDRLQDRCLSYTEKLCLSEDIANKEQLFLFLDNTHKDTQNTARELYHKITNIQREWRLLIQKIHATREFIYHCGAADETRLMVHFNEELQNEINDICAQSHMASHHALLLQDQMHALSKNPEDALRETMSKIKQKLALAEQQFKLLSLRFTDFLVAQEKIPHYRYPEEVPGSNNLLKGTDTTPTSKHEETQEPEPLLQIQKREAIDKFTSLHDITKNQLLAKRTLLQELKVKCNNENLITNANDALQDLAESVQHIETDIANLEDEEHWQESMALHAAYQEIAEQTASQRMQKIEEIFMKIIENCTISHTMSPSVSYGFHIVRKGETLESLAKKYDVPISAITECNTISLPIEEGELLRIPQN